MNAIEDADPDRDPRRSGTTSDSPDAGEVATEVAEPTQAAVDPAVKVEFVAFYRESAPRLVAFLRWQGAPLPDAAECAQEALTLAFRSWSAIREPRAWCRVVASRLYARRLASLEEPVADLETAKSPLLPRRTDIEALEQHHDVLRLLDKLPLRQRQIMAWTYDGATPTEIAEALQISPEAARASLKKARTTLRQQLLDTGGETR